MYVNIRGSFLSILDKVGLDCDEFLFYAKDKNIDIVPYFVWFNYMSIVDGMVEKIKIEERKQKISTDEEVQQNNITIIFKLVTEEMSKAIEKKKEQERKELEKKDKIQTEGEQTDSTDQDQEQKKQKLKSKHIIDKINERRQIRTVIVHEQVELVQQDKSIRIEEEPKKSIRQKKKEKASKKSIYLPELASISAISKLAGISSNILISKMIEMEIPVKSINQNLDRDTASILLDEFDVEVTTELQEDEKIEIANIKLDFVERHPVVAIMGHVDHGKTSLLDYIRKTKITSSEAGGITQKICAYHVSTKKGSITFVDTPGHAAFSTMRARGAKLTDIVVLIVAADDGVMPQTIEAIEHIKSESVPIIVAITKIDKSTDKIDKIKSDLANYDIVSEEWGGNTMFQTVSSKTGEGVNELLDSIVVLSEILELKAPINCPSKGIVIESFLDKSRGAIATVLVQEGKLKTGSIIVAGTQYGKIRNLVNCEGKRMKEICPSMPAEVLGLSGVPSAGEEFIVVDSEKKAKEHIEYLKTKSSTATEIRQQVITSRQLAEISSDKKQINVILKADSNGSLEALITMVNQLIDKYKQESIIKIVDCGVGNPNESDIDMAVASNGLLCCFNVKLEQNIRQNAESKSITILNSNVIYNVIDRLEDSIKKAIGPKYEISVLGTASVRETFELSNGKQIAGCIVSSGLIKIGNQVRIIRNEEIIHDGNIESIRRFKNEVSEIKSGLECGIGVTGFSDTQVGDLIESYAIIPIERT